MKANNCIPQQASKIFFGSLALFAAFILIILGITLLPVVGIFLALPLIALSIYIFRLQLNDQCELDLSTE